MTCKCGRLEGEILGLINSVQICPEIANTVVETCLKVRACFADRLNFGRLLCLYRANIYDLNDIYHCIIDIVLFVIIKVHALKC